LFHECEINAAVAESFPPAACRSRAVDDVRLVAGFDRHYRRSDETGADARPAA
jgi:hypothetical protein